MIVYGADVYKDSFNYYTTTENYKREIALNCVSNVIPIFPSSVYYGYGIRGVERIENGTIYLYVDLSYLFSDSFNFFDCVINPIIVISNEQNISGKDIDYVSYLRFEIDMSSFNCILSKFYYPVFREDYLTLMNSNINIILKENVYREYRQYVSFSNDLYDEEIELFKYFIKIYGQDSKYNPRHLYKKKRLKVYHSFSDYDDLKYLLFRLFSNIPPSYFEFEFHRHSGPYIKSKFVPSLEEMKSLFDFRFDLDNLSDYDYFIVHGNKNLDKWEILTSNVDKPKCVSKKK